MCDAKIRPFRPVNDTEVHCSRLYQRHLSHLAPLFDYAFPGSVSDISWLEDDRRTFRGDWADCPQSGCFLPAGHHGRHEIVAELPDGP